MFTKILWSLLTLAILLGILWQFYPLTDANERIEKLPLTGSDFEGKNLKLNSFEASFFKGINLIKRLYTVGDDNYFVYVLDGTHNRHAVHDPTYCFRGGGWDIIRKEPFPLEPGLASRYFLQQKNQKKEVMLWFSDGSHRYASPFRYWWQTTLRRLTLGYSNREPVLIVVQPVNHTPEDWDEFFDEFPNILQI